MFHYAEELVNDSLFLYCVPIACSAGLIRLTDGPDSYQGRLEVCLNGVWGTVCRDSFDGSDAMVACKQLGFSQTSEFNSFFYSYYRLVCYD